MNVLDYTVNLISWQTGLTSRTRDEVFEEMLKTFCTREFMDANPELSEADILNALIEREHQRTTAVGKEIAFPHARLENLNRAFFALGVLPEPVLFEDEPVRIVCLILVPTIDPSISLKIMAQLSRKLSDVAMRESVFNAENSDMLRNLFRRSELRIDGPVCARDIMRLPRWSVKEDTLISECAYMMARDHLRAVPVLDSQKRIVGEITSESLFRYGLPDFFAKLKSVSFIAEFDPFEKYFEDERNIPSVDVMSDRFRTVPLDYTLMEIVFDLAILRFNKLYVTDADGHWVGAIDQGTVLNNVINY
ncbi:PTS sugar transporter subunit IIA [Tichowtungia aerotolerans]|uniref:PTS transporter subunit EIIA n=1 Tax=Tichowtungia aerotolerans TaxID=2697043 RepID=A0A6P1M2S8_9BACT|nr:PTS sugar transporter subunit IIA [Tichowtungia aerotolerans]QHI68137.1 PTS transporter subunit EIIA [Tichowtungia aerotolerans]